MSRITSALRATAAVVAISLISAPALARSSGADAQQFAEHSTTRYDGNGGIIVRVTDNSAMRYDGNGGIIVRVTDNSAMRYDGNGGIIVR